MSHERLAREERVAMSETRRVLPPKRARPGREVHRERRLLHPRITRRAASRSATVRAFCSGATGVQSSSRDLVADRATMQKSVETGGCC